MKNIRFRARGAHGLKRKIYDVYVMDRYSLEHIGLMLWVTFGTPVALVMTLGLGSQPCLICSLPTCWQRLLAGWHESVADGWSNPQLVQPNSQPPFNPFSLPLTLMPLQDGQPAFLYALKTPFFA